MAQSGKGRIEIFEDFYGEEDLVANTTEGRAFGMSGLRVIGAGSGDTDSGITSQESDPALNGVGRFIATATTGGLTTALATAKMFTAAAMGTLVMEVRVQFDDVLTKSCWIGFCDTNDNDEEIPASITTTAITLTASNQVGFCFDGNATSVANWYYTFKGGSTTGDTVSANQDSSVTLTDATWDILRIEVDPDGTARWYINDVHKKTLEGALSTTTYVCAFVGIESEGTAVENMDVDYILVRANRDWTV